MNRRTRPFRMLIAAIAGFALLIPATPASAAVTTLEAGLAGGDAEVPDPGDPDGSGAAQIKINVRRERACFTLVVLDIALPTAAAHIHEGAEGVAGDIVVTLKAPVEVGNTGIGLATGCARNQERPLLRDIKNNPSQFYVNVHNADFPGGAVRGQLEAA
jgi:hypothetical protein